VAGVLAAGVIFTACDTTPGARDLDNLPPQLSELDFTPRVVDLGTATVDNGEVDIAFTVSVRAEDAYDDLDSVSYVVRPPLRSSEPSARGVLEPSGGGLFTANATLQLAAGLPGNYTVVVYATDRLGQLSNQVQGNLLLDDSNATGSPPVIDAVVSIPEPINPPTTLFVVATVSDPDGLVNILRVEITTPAGDTFSMFDDGEQLGDQVAGDGDYTAAFDVPAGVPEGVQTFEIRAFDRNGNQSEVVEHPVTIN